MIHTCKASCFATLADLAAFNHYKALGWSDKDAFAKGDNGVGCWGDLTAQTHTPMVACTPEDMIETCGSVEAAKHQRVLLVMGKASTEAIVADRMPHRANITNGAGLDMNPATVAALGLPPENDMVTLSWGPIKNATQV